MVSDSVLIFITANVALSVICFSVYLSYLKEKNKFNCKKCKGEGSGSKTLKPPPPPPPPRR